MTPFNELMEDDDDCLLTEQIQELLIKNHKVMFKQPHNQEYFAKWINDGVYDLQLDVYDGIKLVMDRVAQGKLVLKTFGYINTVIKNRYMERTGTPSLESVVDDLTKKLRGE